MNNKLFYIPIETKDRELLGKLLLAATLAGRGWFVILGHQTALRKFAPNFLPGIYSHISIPEVKYERYIVPYSKIGVKSTCICEEGVIYSDGEDYCNRKVGIGALRLTEKFFAVGERQLNDIKNFRNAKDNQVVTVGNPRFDVLREKFRAPYEVMARSIKQRYGKYILINTNFSRCNPHKGYGDRLSDSKKKGMLISEAQEILWHDLLAYKKNTLTNFKQLISRLSNEFKDFTIVIRPHPSEDHSIWNDLSGAYGNVIVYAENSANVWMLGAEVVIHNGCTTGIEGFLLGRPVIAYVPEPDSEFSSNPANSVSFELQSETDVVDAVKKVLNGLSLDDSSSYESKRCILKRYIENIDGPYSCDMIAEEIDEIDVSEFERAELKNRLRAHRKTARLTTRSLYTFVKKIVSKKLGSGDKASVKRQKFPGLSRSDITEPLMMWHESKAIASVPTVDAVDKDFFCIYYEWDSKAKGGL